MKDMKKILVLIIAAVSGMSVWADSIAVQEMGIEYCFPKTEATVVVQYKQEVFHPGKYAAWAQPLLGIDEQISRDTTVTSVRSAKIQTRAVADRSRVYTVHPESGREMQLLNVSREGILLGYNTAASQQPSADSRKKDKPADRDRTTSRSPKVLPLQESTFKNDTALYQAKAVAKQIFQLRDNRAYLLSGEMENMPTDGTALKTLLAEIDKQEKALTALFTGTVTTSTRHLRIAFDPARAQDTLIAVIGGDSLRLRVEPEPREAAETAVNPKAKPKKGAPLPSQIYYNLPGRATVTVLAGGKPLTEEQIPVAQSGVAVPLSTDLFEGGGLHIVFDPETGNITSISRDK